jgi:hypothetical protein
VGIWHFYTQKVKILHPWDKACGQKYLNFPPGANVTSVYKSQNVHHMSSAQHWGGYTMSKYSPMG